MGCMLLVDDDTDICELLMEVFQEEGYQLTCATNGEDALRLLQRMSTLPHLILLNLLMPVMDGSSFLTTLRSEPRLAALPVIVLSAQSNLSARAEQLSVQGYLPKPFDLDEVLALIAQYCSSPAR